MAILAVALLLRVGFVATQPHFRPSADAASFDRTAVSLAEHGRYPPSTIAPSGGPSAFRPPGYPYLLGALYRVTGTAASSSRFVLARLLSAVLSTGIVAVVGFTAALLWGWGIAAMAAMLLAAVYPPLVTIGDAMLSEPLFALLALGAVAAILMARRAGRPIGWAVAAGLLVGLAALTRTNGIILVLPLAAGLWQPPRRRWSSLVSPAAALLTALLVLVPWTIRNDVAFHRFVPISTQAGFTLAGTYNQVSMHQTGNPAGWLVPTMAPYDRLLRPGENEAQIEAAFRSTVGSFIRRHPGYVLKVGYFNLGRLLGLQGPAFEHNAAAESGLRFGESDLDVYSFYVLGVVALIAIGLRAPRRGPPFLWSVPVLLALSLIFVSADMRYRLPIDPFLILCVAAAGGALPWSSRRFRLPLPAASRPRSAE